MTSRLYIVRSALSAALFDRLDRDATVILLSPESFLGTPDDVPRRVRERRSMLMAAASGAIGGAALESGLAADWFVAEEGSSLRLDPLPPGVAAGLLARSGHAARRLLLRPGGMISVEEALEAGTCDALVPRGEDSVKWLQEWLGWRSLAALASAAALIRRRGGDSLERAEFARLFAESTPQRGLAAFLARRQPDFSDRIIVETI